MILMSSEYLRTGLGLETPVLQSCKRNGVAKRAEGGQNRVTMKVGEEPIRSRKESGLMAVVTVEY